MDIHAIIQGGHHRVGQYGEGATEKDGACQDTQRKGGGRLLIGDGLTRCGLAAPASDGRRPSWVGGVWGSAPKRPPISQGHLDGLAFYARRPTGSGNCLGLPIRGITRRRSSCLALAVLSLLP